MALWNVVSYISGAASLCSGSINLPALCAADIGTMGNALSGIAWSSIVLGSTCNPPPRWKAALQNVRERMKDSQHDSDVDQAEQAPSPPKSAWGLSLGALPNV